MKTAPITVEYLDHMGSDLDVVNAARVSFAKESQWDYTNSRCVDENFNPILECSDKSLSEQDQKLIKYLAEHNHWSPFSHCYLKFRIKAPIFVARQLQKHTVGLAWNEVSRRYVDSEPEFYVPTGFRGRSKDAKQGSDGEIKNIWWIPEDSFYDVATGVEEITYACLRRYLRMIEEGVCPEQARMVLPQNTITEWIWSGSLAAFARVVKLRTDPHSQYETSLVAHGIKYSLVNHFPYSTESLLK